MRGHSVRTLNDSVLLVRLTLVWDEEEEDESWNPAEPSKELDPSNEAFVAGPAALTRSCEKCK
eukprot:CAMPEP_0184362260 /NCGR_PEP_ID=MMETSP1089-20130417/133981_1 /TAXON_ID=38269 ORGANISM="Gloeochaete wittrockiana, Strain SAG46.84" /NCGR_SAMPLE_ID=MMETSP1089 /ASSEMBLY_ACC=CAM_ASM_000445 /LENGTH=62 /DNA_ID=CAMNT_0026702267 /DNA_START=40 /DNA_END=228 /DNA_ORIENTATION=-